MHGVTVNLADGSHMQRSASYPLANLPLRSWKRHNFAGCSHINRIISLIPRPCFSQLVQNNDKPTRWKIKIKIKHFRKSTDEFSGYDCLERWIFYENFINLIIVSVDIHSTLFLSTILSVSSCICTYKITLTYSTSVSNSPIEFQLQIMIKIEIDFMIRIKRLLIFLQFVSLEIVTYQIVRMKCHPKISWNFRNLVRPPIISHQLCWVNDLKQPYWYRQISGRPIAHSDFSSLWSVDNTCNQRGFLALRHNSNSNNDDKFQLSIDYLSRFGNLLSRAEHQLLTNERCGFERYNMENARFRSLSRLTVG